MTATGLAPRLEDEATDPGDVREPPPDEVADPGETPATAGADGGVIVTDEDRESTSTLSLFEGDEGGLDVEQRKALVTLLKNRFISARTNPREWAGLMRNPRLIRSRLNDMFLDLVLHPQHEVAWKRQVVPEAGGRFPTVLHDLAWGREETILLVFLRTRFRVEMAAGAERAYVDRAEMDEYVTEQRPPTATDIVGDRRRTARAIEGIYRCGLLLGRSDADRWEIANAIDVLLPLETLQSVLAWMRDQNGHPEGPGPTGQAGDEAGPDPAGSDHGTTGDEGTGDGTTSDGGSGDEGSDDEAAEGRR